MFHELELCFLHLNLNIPLLTFALFSLYENYASLCFCMPFWWMTFWTVQQALLQIREQLKRKECYGIDMILNHEGSRVEGICVCTMWLLFQSKRCHCIQHRPQRQSTPTAVTAATWWPSRSEQWSCITDEQRWADDDNHRALPLTGSPFL